ncbi:hypothetical protein L1049_002079 [Liquidambar formosana]|uniref:Chalcone isomerase n=1 Tax=Liquidambar formosana TaxID=63359 RepID=A0AAP0NGG5_LIQFO
MATTVEDVIAKTETVEIDPKAQTLKAENVIANGEKAKENVNCENGKEAAEKNERVQEEKEAAGKEPDTAVVLKEEEKKEEVAVEIEPKTGVSFPVKLDDGKHLNSVGLRKKSMCGMGIKIYSFGIYADNEKLKDLLKSKIGKAPAKPTKEMYQAVIDSDVGMMVRLVIVFPGLTMSMVRKNFDEGLGASIKKLIALQKI